MLKCGKAIVDIGLGGGVGEGVATSMGNVIRSLRAESATAGNVLCIPRNTSRLHQIGHLMKLSECLMISQQIDKQCSKTSTLFFLFYESRNRSFLDEGLPKSIAPPPQN